MYYFAILSIQTLSLLFASYTTFCAINDCTNLIEQFAQSATRKTRFYKFNFINNLFRHVRHKPVCSFSPFPVTPLES
jgi:hypothetical protein